MLYNAKWFSIIMVTIRYIWLSEGVYVYMKRWKRYIVVFFDCADSELVHVFKIDDDVGVEISCFVSLLACLNSYCMFVLLSEIHIFYQIS